MYFASLSQTNQKLTGNKGTTGRGTEHSEHGDYNGDHAHESDLNTRANQGTKNS